MITNYPSVCLSINLSRFGSVLKRLNQSSNAALSRPF